MKSWKPRARTAVIAVASFVLLITVLPQIASGFGLTSLANRIVGSESCVGTSSGSSGGSSMCCSGSSGSSGSSQCSGTGTVTGTVTVTGAPKRFSPAYLGAGACPVSSPPGQVCSDPQYALASSDGVYTLSLAVGTWRMSGFYENNAYGGAFLGPAQTVTVTAGGTIQADLSVPYEKPASLSGTITVRNVPSFDPIEQLSVLLCPSYAPYNGVSQSIACVNGYGSDITETPTGTATASYALTGLPPVTWTAYPSFCAESGCGTNAKRGVTVTLSPGGSGTADVSTDFLLPGQALLTGTISVTGAPAGFSDEVGVTACPESSSGLNACHDFYGFSGNRYSLVLDAGQWSIKAFYLAAPYDNAVDGPTQVVTLRAKQTMTLYLSVPYQEPGTAAGTITVSGLPADVKVESYTMTACPAAEPWTGGVPAPECVSEYSGPSGFGFGAADRTEAKSADTAANPPAGHTEAAKSPFDAYSLPTLTAGTWLLYPGYETAFGSVTSMNGRPVTVFSGKTTTRDVTVTYRQPSQAAVTGTVTVVGAPSNGADESGVLACTSDPTQGSCPGEVLTYSQQNGTYTTLLAPGTWWLEGFVDVFGGTTPSQSTSRVKEVVLAAGTERTKNFTVTVGAP
jgi:hypothetical protein